MLHADMAEVNQTRLDYYLQREHARRSAELIRLRRQQERRHKQLLRWYSEEYDLFDNLGLIDAFYDAGMVIKRYHPTVFVSAPVVGPTQTEYEPFNMSLRWGYERIITPSETTYQSYLVRCDLVVNPNHRLLGLKFNTAPNPLPIKIAKTQPHVMVEALEDAIIGAPIELLSPEEYSSLPERTPLITI